MKANWLNKNLCSFDEKTRIELGPQLIELECCEANLKDTVTSPHYRIGQRDALGKIIMPERTGNSEHHAKDHYGCVAEGEMMTCVDWREKRVPKVWKIYKFEAMLDDDGEPMLDDNKKAIGKFIKVGEDENKDDALDFAKTLAGEM